MAYKDKVSLADEQQRLILADPQTSGGLLIAVEPDFAEES
jgi:selenide,water dikinase